MNPKSARSNWAPSFSSQKKPAATHQLCYRTALFHQFLSDLRHTRHPDGRHWTGTRAKPDQPPCTKCAEETGKLPPNQVPSAIWWVVFGPSGVDAASGIACRLTYRLQVAGCTAPGPSRCRPAFCCCSCKSVTFDTRGAAATTTTGFIFTQRVQHVFPVLRSPSITCHALDGNPGHVKTTLLCLVGLLHGGQT